MNALRDHLRRHLTWPRVVFTLILLLWVKKFLAVEPYTQGEVKPNGQYQRVFARLDGHYIHLERMSLFFDGDLDLSNQLATWGDPLGTATLPTTTGKNYLYPIGSALLELPAFAAAHGVAKVRNALGDDLPMHGYDRFHQRWTFFSALLAGFASLLVGYRLARDGRRGDAHLIIKQRPRGFERSAHFFNAHLVARALFFHDNLELAFAMLRNG